MDEATARVLLENNLADVRFIKQQQWQILCFCFLVIGAITALALGFGKCHYEFRNFLMFFGCLIAVTGCLLQLHYFRELNVSRNKGRTHLENLKCPDTGEPVGWDILRTWFFCAVIVFSLVACIYSILLKCPNP